MKTDHWNKRLSVKQVKWAFNYIQNKQILSYSHKLGLTPSPHYSHEELILFLLENLKYDAQGKDYITKMKTAWRRYIQPKKKPVELDYKTYNHLKKLAGKEEIKATLERIIYNELKAYRDEKRQITEQNNRTKFHKRLSASRAFRGAMVQLKKKNAELITINDALLDKVQMQENEQNTSQEKTSSGVNKKKLSFKDLKCNAFEYSVPLNSYQYDCESKKTINMKSEGAPTIGNSKKVKRPIKTIADIVASDLNKK